MYLLPAVNLQLRPRLLALAPGTRIVSHDWDIGDWSPDRTVTVDVPEKALGRDKFSRVHLWVVPADVHGTLVRARSRPRHRQRFQPSRRRCGGRQPRAGLLVFDGRIAGSTLRADGMHAIGLRLDGATLRLLAPVATIGARGFERARAAVCP